MLIYAGIVFVLGILIVFMLPISKPSKKEIPFCPKADNSDRDFAHILNYLDNAPYGEIK